MRQNQSKWVKVFNKIIQISIANPMCSRSLNIIEIDYSTLFFNIFGKAFLLKISRKCLIQSFFFYPVKQLKVGQWFVYKIDPKIGIELKGLSFPSNRPFPLDFFYPCFNLGFPNFQKRVEIYKLDSVHHHEF